MQATFYWILTYSFMAGLCTVLGAVLIFLNPEITRKWLAFFLGLATGVMAGVIAFDLVPSSIQQSDLGGFGLGTACGWFLAYTAGVVLGSDVGEKSYRNLGFLIMLGIAFHDLPEGMAIALGCGMGIQTVKAIALGIGLHNLPEGMAIAAPLVMAGVEKRKIAWQTLLVGLITPLGAVLGTAAYIHLPRYYGILLGLAAGFMGYLSVCQLWPSAKRAGVPWCYLGFVVGLMVIAAASW